MKNAVILDSSLFRLSSTNVLHADCYGGSSVLCVRTCSSSPDFRQDTAALHLATFMYQIKNPKWTCKCFCISWTSIIPGKCQSPGQSTLPPDDWCQLRFMCNNRILEYKSQWKYTEANFDCNAITEDTCFSHSISD